jgi:predicted secreted protein
MAAHAGSEGIVKIGDNQIAEVKSWSLEEVCDTVDASIIGTEWRKHLATIRSWSGSIEAFWDETDANGQGAFKLGSSVELKLYPEGVGNEKHYFSGTAIVSNISRQGAFDGLVESSFSFQGNGNLTKIKQQQQQEN